MTKRSIVCWITLLFLLILLTGCALGAIDNTWNPSTSENSWNYSQEIVVTENSGKTLQGYTVPVSLNSSISISRSKNDGSDIRFLSGDRTLNYWIETWDPENKKPYLGQASVSSCKQDRQNPHEI